MKPKTDVLFGASRNATHRMKKAAPLLAAALAFGGLSTAHAQKAAPKPGFYQWAVPPPMGWNSWDCYGPTVTEAEVRANADCAGVVAGAGRGRWGHRAGLVDGPGSGGAYE